MIPILLAVSTAENVKTENTGYVSDGKKYEAYLAYNEDNKEKRPGIVVLPEWWGLNDYTKRRARELAELGYVALAVDVYGNGETGNTPTEAENLATPYYNDPQKAKTIIEAAVEKLKSFEQVDASQIGAIGYCFGGYLALNAAKLGSDLKGVVSFHGGLTGAVPNPGDVKAKVLVCHGAEDNFENDNVEPFKEQMDRAKADYTFIEYPNAVHAFSNPNATERGKQFDMNIRYDEEADKNSWNDMKKFLANVFS